jgi:hypothetical protein
MDLGITSAHQAVVIDDPCAVVARARAVPTRESLEVRYDKPSNWTNCRVTLGDQTPDELTVESAKLVRSTSSTGNARTGKRSLLVRAPGRIRTCAPRSGGVCSIP